MLQPGALVRVKTGPFRGFEGVVQRRQGRTHLLVAVNFLQQGASVLIDDCQVDPLD
jgi:transcription antitermination factor NusG